MSDRNDFEYTTFDLQCQHPELDDIKKKIRKLFGEGYTWTCPRCFKQYVLTQGRGNYWYWQDILAAQNLQAVEAEEKKIVQEMRKRGIL